MFRTTLNIATIFSLSVRALSLSRMDPGNHTPRYNTSHRNPSGFNLSLNYRQSDDYILHSYVNQENCTPPSTPNTGSNNTSYSTTKSNISTPNSVKSLSSKKQLDKDSESVYALSELDQNSPFKKRMVTGSNSDFVPNISANIPQIRKFSLEETDDSDLLDKIYESPRREGEAEVKTVAKRSNSGSAILSRNKDSAISLDNNNIRDVPQLGQSQNASTGSANSSSSSTNTVGVTSVTNSNSKSIDSNQSNTIFALKKELQQLRAKKNALETEMNEKIEFNERALLKAQEWYENVSNTLMDYEKQRLLMTPQQVLNSSMVNDDDTESLFTFRENNNNDDSSSSFSSEDSERRLSTELTQYRQIWEDKEIEKQRLLQAKDSLERGILSQLQNRIYSIENEIDYIKLNDKYLNKNSTVDLQNRIKYLEEVEQNLLEAIRIDISGENRELNLEFLSNVREYIELERKKL